MAGRTRSSLPTDQRRRNTTIPGMTGGSAEAQRAWRSPPERQQRTLWLPGPLQHLGPLHSGQVCPTVQASLQPPRPRGFQATGNADHPWAGLTSVLSTPQSQHKGPQQLDPTFGLTSEVSPAPKTGTGPLGLTLPGVTAIVASKLH